VLTYTINFIICIQAHRDASIQVLINNRLYRNFTVKQTNEEHKFKLHEILHRQNATAVPALCNKNRVLRIDMSEAGSDASVQLMS